VSSVVQQGEPIQENKAERFLIAPSNLGALCQWRRLVLECLQHMLRLANLFRRNLNLLDFKDGGLEAGKKE
jgi:hypothetical protein